MWAKSYLFTEIFGTSEDDAPELDHSKDSENAKEIENLRNEAQALIRIRESMGSKEFPRLVFDKVFKEDIERLRSMEDMWKTRKAPIALGFEELSQQAVGIEENTSRKDQAEWTVAENFVVFLDSLRRLSDRMEELRAQGGESPPILTFDKDDVDTLDFVAASANLRSIVFGIAPRSKFDIKQMAGNIIPAIATTNAMIASICVLQAFQIMRNDLNKAKMVFLTANGTERRVNSDRLFPPNPTCPVCSVAQSTIIVDASRATLSDLVEDLLRLQLGYGEEISINTEAGLLYDPEEDANLSKTFSELGLKNDATITVIDDADEDAKVNLVLHVSEREAGAADAKPIDLASKPDIPLKPKAPAVETHNHTLTVVTNGHTNGTTSQTNGTLKRTADEAGLEEELIKKKGKVAAKPDDEIVEVDDNDGVILID